MKRSPNTLTVDQLREHRHKCESAVYRAIDEFERVTDMRVSAIDIRRPSSSTESSYPVVQGVDCKVRLI